MPFLRRPVNGGAHITKPLARLCCKSLSCPELRNWESVTQPDSRSQTQLDSPACWYLVQLRCFHCSVLLVFIRHSLSKGSSRAYIPDLSWMKNQTGWNFLPTFWRTVAFYRSITPITVWRKAQYLSWKSVGECFTTLQCNVIQTRANDTHGLWNWL